MERPADVFNPSVLRVRQVSGASHLIERQTSKRSVCADVRSVLFQVLRHARLESGRRFGRQTLKFGIVGGLAFSLLVQVRSRAADQDGLDSSLNEHVIYVDGDPAHRALLQVTTFYPDGEGPFPLAIINHSKAPGDPKSEPRYRSIFLTRYLLSRGYAVALPMMRGFAGSGGVFHVNKCDLEGFGLAEATDIAADGGADSSYGGFDPLTRALKEFQELKVEGRVYAVDDRVVWVPPKPAPAATHFAALNDVNAIPYLNAAGRKGYEAFLNLPKPRAFVVAPDGGWAAAAKGFDPLTRALENLGKKHSNGRAYAVDDNVVWTEDQPSNKQ